MGGSEDSEGVVMIVKLKDPHKTRLMRDFGLLQLFKRILLGDCP